ncbi:MAG: four-carbon acid sugar kinase family protein [Sphingobacteriales bacterium]
MIVVIADDLTGAAELGGLGLRYGLTIEIVTTINKASKADLLIIATDTRSMSEANALQVMESVTASIKNIDPEIIFKKVDSVLRGYVVSEINVHLQQLGLEKALLVPANPAFGRTLTNGKYFINNELIHLTSFAHDPEFPVTSSEVHHMLRVDKDDLFIAKCDAEIPEQGITVGESLTPDDLRQWINKADKNTLLAGGAGLFISLLESLRQKTEAGKYSTEVETPALFVCGSTYDKSRRSIKKILDSGGPVSYMPLDIVLSVNPSDALFDDWADEIVSLLKNHQKAIIAIDVSTTEAHTITAAGLRIKKAIVVEKVFKRIAIKELLVEGGSTAAAIINRLNFDRFFPIGELGPGVIKMKVDAVDDLFLTLKPGSYDWPAYIWNF